VSGATYCEDFTGALEGALPDGWMGGEGLAVKQDGPRRLLAAFEPREEYVVSIPSWRAEGDFRIDWVIKPAPGSLWFTYYKLRLADLELVVGARPPNMDSGESSVALNSSSAHIRYIGTTQASISLFRDGNVCRVYVNGQRVLLGRYGTEAVEGVTMSVSNAGSGFGMFGILMTVKNGASKTDPPRSTSSRNDPPPPEQEDKPDDGVDESGTGTHMVLDEGLMTKTAVILVEAERLARNEHILRALRAGSSDDRARESVLAFQQHFQQPKWAARPDQIAIVDAGGDVIAIDQVARPDTKQWKDEKGAIAWPALKTALTNAATVTDTGQQARTGALVRFTLVPVVDGKKIVGVVVVGYAQRDKK